MLYCFVSVCLLFPHTGKQKSEDCDRSYEKVNGIILDVNLFYCAAFSSLEATNFLIRSKNHDLVKTNVCSTYCFLFHQSIIFARFDFFGNWPGVTVIVGTPICKSVGGTVASWLVHLTLEWAVWVQALAGDIVLCSWARHFTLMVHLSTQVYK